MRLFIAINFSEEIKETLLDAIDELKEQSLGGNFTKEDNLHLTLCFIGETTRADEIKKVMSKIEHESFDLSIRGFGRFRRNGGDIFWTGVEKNESLNSLWRMLTNSLLSNGFDIDSREYRPHITMGRQVTTRKYPSIDVPKTTMSVTQIDLMKSERINGKLTYTSIYGKKLS